MTQGEALSILKTGANVFLTGEPGSGKTHLLNEYVAWLRSCGVEPAITAATGIAATHIAGVTIHSWSGIGIAEHLSGADLDRIASKEHVARRIHKAKVLIIEEISMLSAATFEMVDRVCREVRREDAPFGGLSVILVGDFFQLPPVQKAGREAHFAYESASWRELNPLVCYLTEQHRQDDKDFLEVLSAIRSGLVDELHHERLQTRYKEGAIVVGVPKLFSHNADVDYLNAEELAKISGTLKRFQMSTKGKDTFIEGLKRGCLSPEVLELKKGAVVMFTKNSPQGRFVNGTLGKVIDFDASGMPIVELKNSPSTGPEHRLRVIAEPMEWQVEEQGKVRASISQVPLRLAYAMTVHKSQGMSMDAAVIDLSRAFEYGQGYVALSRVRQLTGLYLVGMNARALEVHPQILEKDRDLRVASEATREAFESMPPVELLGMQKQFIKALGGAWIVMANSKQKTARKKKNSGVLPARLAETLQTVRDAKNLKQAARERGLAVSTIVKHLEELAGIGSLELGDFIHLLPKAAAIDEIREAFVAAGDERLGPVWSALGGRYSFETIRLARLKP